MEIDNGAMRKQLNDLVNQWGWHWMFFSLSYKFDTGYYYLMKTWIQSLFYLVLMTTVLCSTIWKLE